MVGGYDASTGSLELRKPVNFFAPLALLIAGPLNPVGFFAAVPWVDAPFDQMTWATSVAIPLTAGCFGALFYLRDGGVGFMTLFMITGLSTLAACAVTGPVYTMAISVLREFGIYWTIFPVSNFDQAIITSGTFIRIGLTLCTVPLVPAVILLRLIAFRRAPAKKAAISSPGF